MKRVWVCILAVLAVLTLGGCAQQAAPAASPSPSVKVYMPTMAPLPSLVMPQVIRTAPPLNIRNPYGYTEYPAPSPQNAAVTLPESGAARVTAVYSGCSATSCFLLKSDGSMWAWGYNERGELGDGTGKTPPPPSNGAYVKTAVKVMDGVKEVAAGKHHTLMLKQDGSLWGCGSNEYGQLGSLNRQDALVPVKIMDHVLTAAAGGMHSLAVSGDGSLWAWGRNENGQLGDGSTKDSAAPVRIFSGVKAVAAGENHSMALLADGTLWTWGDNASGQLGDGTTKDRLKPKKIMKGVAGLAAGDGQGITKSTPATYITTYQLKKKHGFWMMVPHRSPLTYTYYPGRDGDFSLAVKADGTLWAWGCNGHGQLGNGKTKNSAKPVKVLGGVKTAVAGGSFALALKEDGSLWVWGTRDFAQLAGGSAAAAAKPKQLMQGVACVAASYTGVIVLRYDGSIAECLTAATTPAP